MIIEWKSLLANNNIPEHQWPASVEEFGTKEASDRFGASVAGTLAIVTYPPDIPVTVQNPATGVSEWNPVAKTAMGLIYKAYKQSLGQLSPPAWSRSANSVRFHATTQS